MVLANLNIERCALSPLLLLLLTGPDQPRGPPSGDSDREAYRRGPAPGMEPKGGAPSDFRPEFVRLHSLFIYCSLDVLL